MTKKSSKSSSNVSVKSAANRGATAKSTKARPAASTSELTPTKTGKAAPVMLAAPSMTERDGKPTEKVRHRTDHDSVKGERGAAPGGAARDPRLPPAGTVLIKRDRLRLPVSECAVEADGFRYKGNLYRSLSAAARAAAADQGTQTNVNGFVYWGIVKATRPAKDLGKRLRNLGARYPEHATTLLTGDDAAEIRTELRRTVEEHAACLTNLLAKSAA